MHHETWTNGAATKNARDIYGNGDCFEHATVWRTVGINLPLCWLKLKLFWASNVSTCWRNCHNYMKLTGPNAMSVLNYLIRQWYNTVDRSVFTLVLRKPSQGFPTHQCKSIILLLLLLLLLLLFLLLLPLFSSLLLFLLLLLLLFFSLLLLVAFDP